MSTFLSVFIYTCIKQVGEHGFLIRFHDAKDRTRFVQIWMQTKVCMWSIKDWWDPIEEPFLTDARQVKRIFSFVISIVRCTTTTLSVLFCNNRSKKNSVVTPIYGLLSERELNCVAMKLSRQFAGWLHELSKSILRKSSGTGVKQATTNSFFLSTVIDGLRSASV